jgi:hypothetical protein
MQRMEKTGMMIQAQASAETVGWLPASPGGLPGLNLWIAVAGDQAIEAAPRGLTSTVRTGRNGLSRGAFGVVECARICIEYTAVQSQRSTLFTA